MIDKTTEASVDLINIKLKIISKQEKHQKKTTGRYAIKKCNCYISPYTHVFANYKNKTKKTQTQTIFVISTHIKEK